MQILVIKTAAHKAELNRENRLSLTMGTGDKAKDFAESNSSGVKYSVQAKVPVTCVGKRGQLVSNNWSILLDYHPSGSNN